MIARHIVISGKVQGVFFRKNTKQKADNLDISGWVKNADDDKVEIFAQGSEENINSFINWCKHGPPKAEVKNIQVQEKKVNNTLNEFSIVYED